MNFRDVVNSAIEDRQAKIAYPLVGVVTCYHEDTHMVTVRCTSRSGNKFINYELPWITESPGILNSEPEEGLHVIIGFRMGDDEHPMIMGRYDPYYATTIKPASKRKIESIATKTAGKLI